MYLFWFEASKQRHKPLNFLNRGHSQTWHTVLAVWSLMHVRGMALSLWEFMLLYLCRFRTVWSIKVKENNFSQVWKPITALLKQKKSFFFFFTTQVFSPEEENMTWHSENHLVLSQSPLQSFQIHCSELLIRPVCTREITEGSYWSRSISF